MPSLLTRTVVVHGILLIFDCIGAINLKYPILIADADIYLKVVVKTFEPPPGGHRGYAKIESVSRKSHDYSQPQFHLVAAVYPRAPRHG